MWVPGWWGCSLGGGLPPGGGLSPQSGPPQRPQDGWPEGAEGEPCVLWESSWDSRPACGLALLDLGDSIGIAR